MLEPLTQLLNNPPKPVQPEPNQAIEPAQKSLSALMGHSKPQTMHTTSYIHNHAVTWVLIDILSFIQESVTKYSRIPLRQVDSFQVLVGNGEELPCSLLCPQITITLDSHDFCIDLFVIPLSGADLILGV